MTEPDKERRKQLRAKGAEGLTVGVESQAPGVPVRDISLSGISFTLDAPVEFMTRLMMTLVFPSGRASERQASAPAGVQCEGAVVRCDPVRDGREDRYDVAVFFTHLKDSAKEAIEEYVRTH